MMGPLWEREERKHVGLPPYVFLRLFGRREIIGPSRTWSK